MRERLKECFFFEEYNENEDREQRHTVLFHKYLVNLLFMNAPLIKNTLYIHKKKWSKIIYNDLLSFFTIQL